MPARLRLGSALRGDTRASDVDLVARVWRCGAHIAESSIDREKELGEARAKTPIRDRVNNGRTIRPRGSPRRQFRRCCSGRSGTPCPHTAQSESARVKGRPPAATAIRSDRRREVIRGFNTDLADIRLFSVVCSSRNVLTASKSVTPKPGGRWTSPRQSVSERGTPFA